jgi:hypothetical protein
MSGEENNIVGNNKLEGESNMIFGNFEFRQS